MAIVKEAKTELYKLLLGDKTHAAQSEVLPNPSFAGMGNTGYIDSFKKEVLNTSNEYIKKIESFENKEFALIEYTLNGSVENAIVILNNIINYDDNGDVTKHEEIFYVITDQVNGFNPAKLPKIWDFKISSTGEIFGLSNGLTNGAKPANANNIHFFIFNDITPLLGVLTNAELIEESFFSAIVDVETEIKDDKSGNRIGGNKAFGDIRDIDNKYGFNQDEMSDDTFAFAFWSHDTKKINLIRFQTDTINIDPKAITYNINEEVSLSQGSDDGDEFSDISIVDVLTGELNNSIGTLITSTQKDASSNQIIPVGFSLNATNADTSNSKLMPFKKSGELIHASIKYFTIDIPNSTKDIKSLIEKTLAKIPQGTIVDTINLNLRIGELNVDTDKTFIDGVVAGTVTRIAYQALYDARAISTGGGGYREIIHLKDSKAWYENSDGTKIPMNIKSIQYYPIMRSQQVAANFGYETIVIRLEPSNILSDATMKIIGTRLQQTVQANTTSYLSIDSSSSEIIYKTVQAENNSYEGTAPVFLDPRKIFIPLKKTNGPTPGQFSIFEFTGKGGTQELERPRNALGDSDYSDIDDDSYKIELLDRTSIKEVRLDNQNPLPADQYQLNNNNILTILGIKQNTLISIIYTTLIGEPTMIHTDTTTSGDDLYIAPILHKEELGTLSTTIIGAGDNSDASNNIGPTQLFGFNLYKDLKSIEYNHVAEEIQAGDIKIKHLIGSRQNDIIFIKAFNDDYSRFIEWIQIYPDSFSPNTYSPVINVNNYFTLDRISINKDGRRDKTTFDNAFLDVPPSGNSMVATTNAKATDGNNQDNNKQIIYGMTNHPLFEWDKPLIKTPQESITLNYNISVSVKDTLQGKDLLKQESSETLATLFNKSSTQTHQDVVLANMRLIYKDGSVITTDATPYMTYDEDNELIRVEITLYNKDVGIVGDKIPIKLELVTAADQIMSSIDLEDNACGSVFTNIGWNIIISDDSQTFFKWGANGWGEKPWAPALQNKGVK